MYPVSKLSVVDDDESLLKSVLGLLRCLSYAVEAFASAEGFLRSEALARTKCLILDIRIPGMSGADLQRYLIEHRQTLPTVFITARGDDPACSGVAADGPVDCLSKPFGGDAFVEAISAALSR